MGTTPHPEDTQVSVRCAVLTLSDTRSPDTDRSGQLLQQQLLAAGHQVLAYDVIPDDPRRIQTQLLDCVQQSTLDAVICTGGTGIAPRDTTYDVIARLLEKDLPGFGELFRALSYEEIGSRAMASRAIAGVYQGCLIFSLPGSTPAVRLAMEKLILPELRHLTRLLKP